MSEPKKLFVVQPLPATDPIIGLALWGLEDARRRTRDALKGVNPSALDWQLDGRGHSIATLMYHIAAIEMDWLHTEVMESQPSPEIVKFFPHDVRDAAGRLTIVKGETLPTLWARLDAVRALLLETFKTMSLAEYRRVRVLDSYDVSAEWVLYHLMQHEAEHRDELIRLREFTENEVV
jgi:uncharacterized damage-inducible protein DinB